MGHNSRGISDRFPPLAATSSPASGELTACQETVGDCFHVHTARLGAAEFTSEPVPPEFELFWIALEADELLKRGTGWSAGISLECGGYLLDKPDEPRTFLEIGEAEVARFAPDESNHAKLVKRSAPASNVRFPPIADIRWECE